MGKFDSYFDPPECDPGPCLCCAGEFEDCGCPECPVCGSIGDPKCYEQHGLVYEQWQIENKKHYEAMMAKEAEEEAKAIESIMEQEKQAAEWYSKIQEFRQVDNSEQWDAYRDE